MFLIIENDLGEKKIDFFRGKKVILFGASTYGQKVVEEFEIVHANILFFCDNNTELHGTKIKIFDEELNKEYNVENPEKILDYPAVDVIISSTYFSEIRSQLNNMGIKRIYTIKTGVHRCVIPKENFSNYLLDKEKGNQFLRERIKNTQPFFVGRLGSTELETICHYFYLERRKEHRDIPYQNNVKTNLCIQSGFFPKSDMLIDSFAERYVQDIKELNMIWSMWFSKYENMIYSDYIPHIPVTEYRESCFPLMEQEPWTKELKGKKVLVIHPFEESIQQNYENRTKLFNNPEFLPEFQLITIKSVQSVAGTKTDFETWFDALEYMEKQINEIDFEIALIGAGAYGLPLGAYIKRMGKKAIHLGGVLQLFFGIKGKFYDKLGLYNKYWTNPSESEKPSAYMKVESGRYW